MASGDGTTPDHLRLVGGGMDFQYKNRGGGDPPDNGAMEARIAKLEVSLQQVQLDTAVIKSNYASKEDIAKLEAKMHEGLNRVIMWVVGSIFLAQLLPAILKKFGL